MSWIDGDEFEKLRALADRVPQLEADNERLRASIEWLMKQNWKSIDKDNMEFQVTTSCYVRDALLAALKDTTP